MDPVTISAALSAISATAGATSTIGTIATVASPAMTVLGGISDYQAAKAEGKAATVKANYEAKVGEQAAGQERAVAQRKGIEEQRQANLMSSRSRALAGSSDPTAAKLISDIDATGQYNYLSALASGEERARGLEQGADLSRFEGRMKKQEAGRKATKALMSTGASLFEKYGSSSFGDNTSFHPDQIGGEMFSKPYKVFKPYKDYGTQFGPYR